MHKLKIIFLILLVTGCAPPITVITNSQPKVHQISGQKTFSFEQSKDVIWNNILTVFANSEFNIDKINMNAHMVKFRYTGQPNLYIDCGIKRITTDGHEITIPNSSKNYSYRAYQHIHLETYSISNNFTGYVNLVITGNDISSRVLAQFTLELETDEKLTSSRGAQYNRNRHEKLMLNSYKPVYSDFFKTNCRTTGALERQVFEIMSQM